MSENRSINWSVVATVARLVNALGRCRRRSHDRAWFPKYWLRASWIGVCLALSGLVLAPPARAAVGDITEFSVPNAPRGITAGPDGSLWFTEFGGSGIDRITTSGTVTAFPIPPGLSQAITTGPDGNLWFAESTGNKIGRMTPSGTLTEFPVPTTNSYPGGIAAGPDGNLWFTETGSGAVGRITPSGTITEFPTGDSPAFGITAGPDGNVWFSEYSNAVGRINAEGEVTEFPVPSGASADIITAGPDGDLWFTEFCCNKIARMTPSGAVTEFPTTGSGPAGIAPGPDGNLWFAEIQGNSVGRITPSGAITEYPVPRTGGGLGPAFIAEGPDGGMWFTEPGDSQVGRVDVTSAADLSVSQTASPDPVSVGANLTYHLTVTNAGPDPDQEVTLTDQLPAGVDFVSATPTQGACSETTVVLCALGSLVKGGSASVTMVVTPLVAGSLTNAAAVSGSVPDPAPANNQDQVTTTVNPATADLSVTEADYPDPVFLGGTLTYTLTVDNNGPGSAAKVSVQDPLPPATGFESVDYPLSWSCSAPGEGASGTVTCTKASMAPNSNATLTIRVKVDPSASADSTLANSATVGSQTLDPNTANNSAQATTGLLPVGADLSVHESAFPHAVKAGGDLTYRIRVRNAGPEAAQEVVMTDRLPGVIKFVDVHARGWVCMKPSAGETGRVRCTKGSLAPGAVSTIVVVARVGLHAEDGLLVTNMVTARSQITDPSTANNSDSARVRVKHHA